MKSQRVRDDGPGATMFPFLAVLVCTMGALILLLLIISRQVKAAASAAAEAPEAVVTTTAGPDTTGPDLEELKTAVEDVSWRIEMRQEQRDQTAADLHDQRLKLSHLEDHLRRLVEQVKALDADLARLETGQLADDQLAQLRERKSALTERIALAKQQLEKAKRDADTQKPTYAVMPFETSNRTSRRPVYIECSAGKVILQPSGIVLNPQDFDGPLGPGNPLATGLRATREYLARNEPLSIEGETEPYPLLLVRPDGIDMYYAARASIKSWGADFGYEMVEQDWDLSYPPEDPSLTHVVASAVEIAKRRQHALAQAAPKLFQQGGGPVQFRAAPEGGGVIPDGPLPGGQYAGGPYARSPYPGRGPGGRPGPGGTDPGNSPFGSSTRGGRLGGQPGSQRSSALSPQAGSPGRGGYAGSFDGRSPSSQGLPGESIDGVPGGLVSQPLEGPQDSPSGSGGQFGRGGSGGPSRNGSSSASQGVALAAPTAGGRGSQKPTDGTGRGQAFRRPGQAPQTGQAGSGPATAGQSGSGSLAGGTPQGSGTPSPGGSSAAGNAANAGPGGEMSLGDAASPEARQRQSLSAQGGSPGQSASAIAQTRGSDWALPGKSHGALAITRPIRARIGRRGMKILSKGSSATGRNVDFTGNDRDAVEEFVAAVWDHIDSWGTAGRASYWRPVVSFEVTPGADRQYERVRGMLDGSGLLIRRKGEDVTAAVP